MDLGSNISKSFDVYFKNNFVTLLLAGLIAGLLSATFFLAGPAIAGMMVLCKKILNGEKADFNELFAHFDKFVPTLIVMLIAAAAYVVAFIIMMIPLLGFLFAIAFFPCLMFIVVFAINYIVELNLAPMDAIKKAFETFSGNFMMNWVYVIVFGFLSGIGAIACGIGAIVTAPLFYLGMAMAYQALSSGAANSGPSVQA